jgi:hypothetical protein
MSPFKVGDRVYHKYAGYGVVCEWALDPRPNSVPVKYDRYLNEYNKNNQTDGDFFPHNWCPVEEIRLLTKLEQVLK